MRRAAHGPERRAPGRVGNPARACAAIGAFVCDHAAHAACGAARVSHAGAAHHPPRHHGVCAQAGRPDARHSRPRRGHWLFSRQPDIQDKSGPATGLPANQLVRLKGAGHLHKIKNPEAFGLGVFMGSLTLTYFRIRMHTIIGAAPFHCPVRDGKEWGQSAMGIRLNLSPLRHKACRWQKDQSGRSNLGGDCS